MRLLIITLIFLFGVTVSICAQSQFPGNINPSTVDVATLNDEQIEQIYTRIQSQGLSINEAIRLATIQGMSNEQANLLRQRLNDISSQTSSGNSTVQGGTARTTGINAESSLFDSEVERILTDTTLISGVAPSGMEDVFQDSIAFMNEMNESSDDTLEPVQPLFGHSIFKDQTLNLFTTTDAARAPDWYVLGSGDQIRITIFGVSQTDLLFEISDEGYIQPTGVPKIFLKGLTKAEAESILVDRLSKFYTFKEEELSLTIKVARTITVNIYGESLSRGGFTISALNTAFNALTAAGGPTDIGSVRKIELLRGDERNIIDVYEFMSNPMTQRNFPLFHNDVIYVPIAQKIVSINGAVKRPMRYELLENESLFDLIEYAGGLNFNTRQDYVQIQRIQNGEAILLEYDLSKIMSGELDIPLQDGDIIRIRETRKNLVQFARIDGSVYFPGQYSLTVNPTLKTLVERAQIRPEAKTDQIFIERKQPDESVRIITVRFDELINSEGDIQLQKEDRIIIYDQKRYRNIEAISVIGEVRSPFERILPFNERIALMDALELAGGIKPTAAKIAYVFRENLFNPEFVQHIPVDLTIDSKFQLQPGDELRVYNQGNYTDPGELSVQGYVNNPINIPYDPDISLTDLLRMSDGLIRGAAKNRIDVFRKNVSLVSGIDYSVIPITIDDSLRVIDPIDSFRLEPFDQIIVRQIPQYNLGTSVKLNGEVKYPGRYPLSSGQLRLSQLIKKAGGLTDQADSKNAIIMRSFENTGPVSINLEDALKEPSNYANNPVLMDGDIIDILPINNVVEIRLDATMYGEQLRLEELSESVVEESRNDRINVVFRGNRSARWYINNFVGGFSDDANKWSVTVTKPNGEVIGTRRRLFFLKDYPTVESGSVITVQKELPKPESEEKNIDWEEIQARSLQATTTLISLLILVDRLNL